METRRQYGANRALRHIARRLARLTGPSWPLAPVPPAAARGVLAACTLCGGDHVCPMDWGETDERHWWVQARCGDCAVWSEIVITNAQAAALDVALDRQVAQIRAAADRMDAERMAEQAEAFVAALRADLIVAADF
jgi:hypothetical protein